MHKHAFALGLRSKEKSTKPFHMEIGEKSQIVPASERRRHRGSIWRQSCRLNTVGPADSDRSNVVNCQPAETMRCMGRRRCILYGDLEEGKRDNCNFRVLMESFRIAQCCLKTTRQTVSDSSIENQFTRYSKTIRLQLLQKDHKSWCNYQSLALAKLFETNSIDVGYDRITQLFTSKQNYQVHQKVALKLTSRFCYNHWRACNNSYVLSRRFTACLLCVILLSYTAFNLFRE